MVLLTQELEWGNVKMDKKAFDYTNIPKEKFEFCQQDASIHDKKFDTKPVGYFKDAMSRFCRNKGSIVAAFIIFFLVFNISQHP